MFEDEVVSFKLTSCLNTHDEDDEDDEDGVFRQLVSLKLTTSSSNIQLYR